MRVQLIHGLEGHPRGRKARALGAHFDLLVPAMDTSDLAGCIGLQSQVLAMWGPALLVGSSFGGSVAVALLQQGHWGGPTLLLAPAALRHGLPAALPAGPPIWIAHAKDDPVVPFADAEALAASRADVRLIACDDDHALTAHTESGALIDWARSLAELA